MKSDSVARIRGNRSMSIESHTIRNVLMQQFRHKTPVFAYLHRTETEKLWLGFCTLPYSHQLKSIPARGPLHSKVSCVIRKVCRRNELQQQQQQRRQENTLAQSPAPKALFLSLFFCFPVSVSANGKGKKMSLQWIIMRFLQFILNENHDWLYQRNWKMDSGLDISREATILHRCTQLTPSFSLWVCVCVFTCLRMQPKIFNIFPGFFFQPIEHILHKHFWMRAKCGSCTNFSILSKQSGSKDADTSQQVKNYAFFEFRRKIEKFSFLE